VESIDGVIHRWLKAQGGVVEADGNDELLRVVADGCHVRGKTALTQVRVALCEMAARGWIRLTFATGNFGSSPITAIVIVVARTMDTTEKLSEQVAALLDENAKLKLALEASQGDVQAAGQLTDEVVAEQARVTSELNELRQQHEGLLAEAERLRSQVSATVSPQQVIARKKAEGRAVTAARARMHAAEATVETLREKLAAARRLIRVKMPSYHFYSMTCGCVIARTDVSQCEYGGRKHPIFPIMVPNMSYAEAKAFISIVLSDAIAQLFPDGAGTIISSDIHGRAMP
jgi:hypothetical protein